MGCMATQVLPDADTRPEGTDTTGDDDPKMFHYVLKNEDRGERGARQSRPGPVRRDLPVTRAPKPGSPVCPDCKKIYEAMSPGFGE